MDRLKEGIGMCGANFHIERARQEIAELLKFRYLFVSDDYDVRQEKARRIRIVKSHIIMAKSLRRK